MDPKFLQILLLSSTGVLCGIVGTLCSIRNAPAGPKRRFIKRVSLWFWLGIAVFVTVLLLLPNALKIAAWALYGIALPVILHRVNRRLAGVGEAEER